MSPRSYPTNIPSSLHQQQLRDSPRMISATLAADAELLWNASPLAVDSEFQSDDTIWGGLGLNSTIDFDSFITNNPYDWVDLPDKTIQIPTTGPQADSSEFSPSLVSTGESQLQQADKELQLISGRTISGFWYGSPVRLLNARLLAEHFNQKLFQFYDSMMMALASRHLSYRCNQFAGKHSYLIESENEAGELKHIYSKRHEDFGACSTSSYAPCRELSQRVSLGGDAPSPIQDSGDSLVPEKMALPCRRITLIGVAHFLDNFAALYGNKLDKEKRNLHERTLTAVLHAFALQSLSGEENITDPNCANQFQLQDPYVRPNQRNCTSSRELFSTAWFNAYSLLLKLKGARSFVHLHTVFLFNMIARPEEVFAKAGFVDDPVQLLDDALRQMQDLLTLVDSFCSRLNPESLFRTMLESSTRIVRWFGYVRDTIASFLSDRDCVLEDLQIRETGWSALINYYLFNNNNLILQILFRVTVQLCHLP